MKNWRNKLMEQIEPETQYNKSSKYLSDAPRSFRENLPEQILGMDLLMRVMNYKQLRGRPILAVKRERFVGMRCSKSERQFLRRLAELYAVDLSTLMRACCLGHPKLTPLRPIHLECVFTLQMIQALVKHELPDSAPKFIDAMEWIHELKEIVPPEVSRGRKVHRLTIRFTEEEYARLKFDRFTSFFWQKLRAQRWYQSRNVSEATLADLEKFLGGLLTGPNSRTKLAAELNRLLKFFREFPHEC